MNYIMMDTELLWLLHASEIGPAETSPVLQFVGKASGEPDTARSLSKVGLTKNGSLSRRGQAIAASLLTPQSLLETASAACVEMPVVSCCQWNGVWTVLLREPYNGIVNIQYPVGQANIREAAVAHFGEPPSPFEAFSISLTVPEAAVFELSHFVIEQRVRELERPLQKEEQRFTAADLFAEDNLQRLALKLARLPEEGYDEVAASIREPQRLIAALPALKEKGVLSGENSPSGMRFSHTPAARKWLMGDARKDTVAVKNVLPEAETEIYHLMEAGFLRVSQQREALLYESVPAPAFKALEAVEADTRWVPASTKGFCLQCGHPHGAEASFCANCGARIDG